MIRSRPGFTVLEAAVALLIIGTSAIGVLSAFGAQSRVAARMRGQLEASALAQHVVAKLRMLDPQDLQPLADSLSSGRFDPPFDRYSWTAKVGPSSGESGLYDVEVHVQHPEAMTDLHTRLFVMPSPGTER